MIEASVANFDELTTGPMTVVDFWAPWCGPCKMMAPALSAVEQKYGDQIKFVKFNVDDDKSIPQRYKVMSMPSLVLFRDGQAKEKVTGLYNASQLSHYFDRKLAETTA
ncbi:thioredoxin [Limosilactobacillus caecicola]|uniref:thioredoxin n=1 Tax=Limosilactobacillus caecicola TaxID=2941332 RepID=UPI00203B4C59|nr:thioredoxin [Limosilactobacillus caecicola]